MRWGACGVLADTGGEHERVQASSTAASEPLAVLVDEVIDREAHGRGLHLELAAHVVADSRDAEHPNFLYSGAARPSRRVPCIWEVEDHAGIDRAPGASPMHSPSRAVNPSVVSRLRRALHRTQLGRRSPGAPRSRVRLRSVGATCGRTGRRDVLVGQAVKSIALHAACANLPRQREPSCATAVARGENPCRAATWGTCGSRSATLSDRHRRCMADGAVRAARAPAGPRSFAASRWARFRVAGSAMHDAMTDTQDSACPGIAIASTMSTYPAPRCRRRPCHPASARRASHRIGRVSALTAARFRIPSILPRAAASRFPCRGAEHAELEARGTRVQHQCKGVHHAPAFSSARERPAPRARTPGFFRRERAVPGTSPADKALTPRTRMTLFLLRLGVN